MCIFASTVGLRILTGSDVLMADGTFKTVPPEFRQLYTIHGVVTDIASRRYVYPLVFCLCVRKHEPTYRTMWVEVKAWAVRHNRRLAVRLTSLQTSRLQR